MRWTTFGIVIAILALLGISYLYLGYQEFKPVGWFVNEGNVRGSALIVDHQTFTLNYQQQQDLIDILNRSNQSQLSEEVEESPLIALYLFDLSEPISLTPLNPDLSAFSVSGSKIKAIDLKDPRQLQSLIEEAL